MGYLDQAIELLDKQIAELQEIRARLVSATTSINSDKPPTLTVSRKSRRLSTAQRRRWSIRDNETIDKTDP